MSNLLMKQIFAMIVYPFQSECRHCAFVSYLCANEDVMQAQIGMDGHLGDRPVESHQEYLQSVTVHVNFDCFRRVKKIPKNSKNISIFVFQLL